MNVANIAGIRIHKKLENHKGAAVLAVASSRYPAIAGNAAMLMKYIADTTVNPALRLSGRSTWDGNAMIPPVHPPLRRPNNKSHNTVGSTYEIRMQVSDVPTAPRAMK